MAMELNLRAEKDDKGGVRVSWMEKIVSDDWEREDYIWLACGLAPSVLFLTVSLNTENFLWFIPAFISAFAVFELYDMMRKRRNYIYFTPSKIFHRGRSFVTDNITRFEYGLQSQLTGVHPRKPESEPMLIRMWIDDAQCYTISSNNWQLQVCHQIRDALVKALNAVRDDNLDADRTKKSGDDDNNRGVPDY